MDIICLYFIVFLISNPIVGHSENDNGIETKTRPRMDFKF